MWSTIERDKFCYYCGVNLSRKNHSIDHLKPLSKGGQDKSFNRVDACRKCNTEKGCLTVDEFRAVWAYRLGLLWTALKFTELRFPGEVKLKRHRRRR